MKSIVYITVLLSLFSYRAHAHGEDKAGPNGGHIKMPSNFHTELIMLPDNQLKIYLLDIQFKNPTTQNSSVSAFYKMGKKQIKLKCKPNDNHYTCIGLPRAFQETLFVKANRAGVKADLNAEYQFPLNDFSKNTAPPVKSGNNPHQHH